MKRKVLLIVIAVLTIIMMTLSLTNVIDDIIGMSIAFVLFIAFDVIVAKYAREMDVKIVEYVMIGFIVVACVLLLFNVRANLKRNKTKDYKFQVVVEKDSSEKTLMFKHDGRDYYTYNLSKVEVIMKKGDKRLGLQDALENGTITLDEILELAIPNDGTVGYKLYLDGGQDKYTNDEYSIIVCEDVSKDVIFSTFNYQYTSDICK